MDCGGFAHWGDCGEKAQGKIMLEIAAATREQEMWERRFKVLYAQHPIWRTVDNDGSWGLRDFLRYAGEVCGFTPDRSGEADETRSGSAEGESGLPEGSST